MNRQILDEASTWFVDFRVGDVDATARERFDEWLRASPEHIRAYMEIAQLYVDIPAPPQLPSVDELIARARTDANVVTLDPTAFKSTESHEAASIHAPRRRRLASRALAASLAIVVVAGGVFLALNLDRDRTYTTDIGERRSITLSDGSTVDLNARSRIKIDFLKSERNVELLDGQALFEVAKDKTRPFIVKSGETVVRAVGTQFQVEHRVSGTTVTVVEGRVTVETAGPAGTGLPVPEQGRARGSRGSGDSISPASTPLSAGEQVTVADGVVARPKRANIAEATAWMQHRLIFDGSRLSDVVDQFNRYNARQLVIENAELQDLHISGVYSSTDPASLIRFLKEQPGIQVLESDQVVRITHP
jgi:transmembrane sensor